MSVPKFLDLVNWSIYAPAKSIKVMVRINGKVYYQYYYIDEFLMYPDVCTSDDVHHHFRVQSTWVYQELNQEESIFKQPNVEPEWERCNYVIHLNLTKHSYIDKRHSYQTFPPPLIGSHANMGLVFHSTWKNVLERVKSCGVKMGTVEC